MSAKQMKFDADARLSLLSGAEQIARAVAVTMGPTGRHVVLQKSFGGPAVTKDGVSVAREVELAHPFENMGQDGASGGQKNRGCCGRRHHRRHGLSARHS